MLWHPSTTRLMTIATGRLFKVLAPIVAPCADADLVAVGNGIYDYSTKMLMGFDPELVFTTKSHVNFVDNAQNPHITMSDGEVWDVNSWMQGLFDVSEVVDFLWRMLGAVIRTNVSWNHSIWLLSEIGNNGKGTLCRLTRNLLGDGAHTSINFKQFAEQFGLDDLLNASAIITDENDADTYIYSAATLKLIITGDLVTIDRKFKSKVKLQFRGMMVQCVNSMSLVKDKTPYERMLDDMFAQMMQNIIKEEYMFKMHSEREAAERPLRVAQEHVGCGEEAQDRQSYHRPCDSRTEGGRVASRVQAVYEADTKADTMDDIEFE